MDADGCAVLGVKIDLRGVEQGLGGDAAPIQAGAPHLTPFHDSGAQSPLGRLQGRRVAARAGADDDQLIIRHSLRSSGSILNMRSVRSKVPILCILRYAFVQRRTGCRAAFTSSGLPMMVWCGASCMAWGSSYALWASIFSTSAA